MRARSACTVVLGLMSNSLTSTSSTAGDMNAGSFGQSVMHFTPGESRASRTSTALCSYHANLPSMDQ